MNTNTSGWSWIGGFAASIVLTDANRNVIAGLSPLDGVWLERSDNATIRNSDFSPHIDNQFTACDPYTSPAGIHLEDSN